MNTELFEKYRKCTRFDEGAGYKTKEFQVISKRRENAEKFDCGNVRGT